MPLFRLHRGTLEESLRTTKIVHKKEDIWVIVHEDFSKSGFGGYITGIIVSKEMLVFDDRRGWYTYPVHAKSKDEKTHICGFLSEPLLEEGSDSGNK